MTPEETAAFDALRAEVGQLRRDLDRALELLDQPTSRDPGMEPAAYPTMEFAQVSVRHVKERIPVSLFACKEESGLYLRDADGKTRLELLVDDQGRARLEIRNAAGQTVIEIGEGEHGGGSVVAFGPEGEPRAALRGTATGGVVNVVDAQGNSRAGFAGTVEGSELVLFNATQRHSVVLRAAELGGGITVHEPSGQVMGMLAGASEGAFLNLNGEQGSPAALLTGHGETGGNVVLFDAEGTIKQTLP